MKKIYLFLLLVVVFSNLAQGQWTVKNSGTTKNLWGVCFVNESLGYVSGDSGTILKTTDGGTTWTPLNTFSNKSFTQLYFADANTGYCASWFDPGCVLYKTLNGGTSWTNISLNVSNWHCGGMWFFSKDTFLLAIGNANFANSRILSTVNGGVSWDTVYKGTTGWLSFFHFPDRQNGYATVSGSRILKTTDGGLNWTELTNLSGNLWMSGNFFFDKNTGIVGGGNYSAGNGSIFKTTDGGATWQTLSTVYGLSQLWFVNATTGYGIGAATGWSYKKIIKTTDVGVSWTVESAPARSINFFNFPSATVGYAVGDTGTILKLGGSSGIAESAADERMQLYPNPANDNLIFTFTGEENMEREISVYDLNGSLKIQQSFHSSSGMVGTGTTPEGLYVVVVKTPDRILTQKVLIMH